MAYTMSPYHGQYELKQDETKVYIGSLKELSIKMMDRILLDMAASGELCDVAAMTAQVPTIQTEIQEALDASNP